MTQLVGAASGVEMTVTTPGASLSSPHDGALRADRRALDRLGSAATGRRLLIDFYASRCCRSVMIGDLTTRWVEEAAAVDAVEIATFGGTTILADRRLVPLLAQGATLVECGPVFARSIGVRLEVPERWIEFLESPAARRGLGEAVGRAG